MNFISLVLTDDGGGGHNLGYARSVGMAVQKFGGRHCALVPSNTNQDQIPSHWLCELNCWSKRTRGSRIKAIRSLVRSLVSGLGKIYSNKEETIIFVDCFTPLKLFAVGLAMLRLDRRSLRVWVMYRYDYPFANGELIFYRLFNRVASVLLPRGNYLTITDSITLSEHLRTKFQRDFLVLPIPHTFENHARSECSKSGELLCWWPGKPLESKGLSIIQKLADAIALTDCNIRIIFSSDANISMSQHNEKITRLPITLSQIEYEELMCSSDIILLPYDPLSYRYRTSGIFVEAISAGKLPLVSANTWMAEELARHGLNECIFDWSCLNPFERIRDMHGDRMVKNKIAKMRENYNSYHCIDSFSRVIKYILIREKSSA